LFVITISIIFSTNNFCFDTIEMWQYSYCPFTSSRKWNTQVHEKRMHQDQLSKPNGNGQRKTDEHHPVQGGHTKRMMHWCTLCNYKSDDRRCMRRHHRRNHIMRKDEYPLPMQSEEQPTDREFMDDSIDVCKIYKLLQRMKKIK
jgi:hypothetical protein